MTTPTPPDAELLARIRQEELLRQQVRDSLTPPAPQKTRFEKLLALLNTHVGVGTVAALLLSAGTFAWTKLDAHLNADERAAERARVQALTDVQNVSPFLPMLAREGSPERALACRVLFHMISSRAINETLGQGLAQETGACLAAQQFNTDGARDGGLIDQQVLAKLDRRATSLAPDTVGATDPVSAAPLNAAESALAQALPRRLYIQYASQAQRDAVLALRKVYEARGWIVPTAEDVGGKAPRTLQVRYFHEADAEAATTTQQLLASLPPFDSMPQAQSPIRLKLQAPPGQIEVWLPAQ